MMIHGDDEEEGDVLKQWSLTRCQWSAETPTDWSGGWKGQTRTLSLSYEYDNDDHLLIDIVQV